MCLIAIKPKGVALTKEFYKSLSRSFHNRNSDGCGFAYKRSNEKEKFIYFKKAIYNIDFLIKEIKKHNITIEDELVVHLRKVSSGSKIGINTHPFVMSYEDKFLTMTEGYIKHDLLFHNGTFNSHISHRSNTSDTYNFVKNIANIKAFTTYVCSLRNRKLQSSLDSLFNNNKVVILSLEKTLFLNKDVNNISFYQENGFIYSNDSFKKQCHSRDFFNTRQYMEAKKNRVTDWVDEDEYWDPQLGRYVFASGIGAGMGHRHVHY